MDAVGAASVRRILPLNKGTAIERLTSYLVAGGVLPLPEATPFKRETALIPQPKMMPVMSSTPAAATLTSGMALTSHHQTCMSTHDVLKAILVDGTVQLRDAVPCLLLQLVQGLIQISDDDRRCLPTNVLNRTRFRQEFLARIVARSIFTPTPVLGKATLLLSLAVVQQDCLDQRLGTHSCPKPQDLSPVDIWVQAFLCRLECRLGSVYRLTRDIPNAVKFGLMAFERASQFHGTIHFRSLRASVACLLGIVYRRSGQLQEASE